MDARGRRNPAKREVQMLTSAGQRRVVWRVETDIHERQERSQETLRLPKRQTIDQPDRDGGLDREIRESTRGPRALRRLRPPRVYRIGRQPEGHIAALDKRPVV